MTPSADPLPLRVDANGDIRVETTRVLLDMVVQAFEDGATPETIIDRYPSLSLAEVYAVIAYYLNNRGEVAEYLRRREERAAEVRRTIEADQPDRAGLRARLMARLAPGGTAGDSPADVSIPVSKTLSNSTV